MPETQRENTPEPQAHFTYTIRLEDDLCQGDVLKKTEPVVGLLGEVHPHYVEDDYTHFLVLTQTCDLVRGRGGPGCKSRYITLAPVRPLDLLIGREIAKRHPRTWIARISTGCVSYPFNLRRRLGQCHSHRDEEDGSTQGKHSQSRPHAT